MLYLAIPAHNEVATIGVLLWRLRTVLAEFPREYEVVVYDDASTDETADVAEQYVNAMPVTVLRGRTPVGYAGAVDALVRHVAAATRYPRRDAMLLLQGDFTDPPGIVPEFARRFEGGADLVVGERTTVVDAPVPVRRLFTAARMALRPFVKVEGVRDLTGSMRLVRISVLRDLLRATDDAPVLVGDSVTANADLLLRLVPHARRIETVPVEPTYGVRMRETRRVTLRDALASLRWGWSARGRRAAPSSAPEGPESGARGGRGERNERNERGERGERRDRSERGERGERGGRVEAELTAEGLRERLPERTERGDRDRDARGGRRERGREREPRAGRPNGERSSTERGSTERINGERTDIAGGAQAASAAGSAEPKRERAPREPRESRPPREPREPREPNAGREPRPPRDRSRARPDADAATRGPVDPALARALDDPFAPPARREDPFASIDRITAGPGAPPDGDVVAGVPIAGSPIPREDPAGGTDGDDTDDETSGDEPREPRRRRSRRSRRGRGRNGEAGAEGAEGAESEAGTADSTRAAADRDADRPGAAREAAFDDAESRHSVDGDTGAVDSGDDVGDGDGDGDGDSGDGMEIGEDGEPRARRRGRRGRRGGTRRSRRKREGAEGAEGAESGENPGPGPGAGGEGSDRGEGRDSRDADGPYSDGAGSDRGDDGR